MKIIHLSDLHIGKYVNGFSMLEDQKYILKQIIGIVDAERPTAVVVAGDIYDKQVPPADAVSVLDEFLTELSVRGLRVLVISGNHDSAERLAFGGRLMRHSGISLSPVYNGTVNPISLTDEYGTVNFYLLPFIKPVNVRQCFPDEKIESYTDAVGAAVRHMRLDTSVRNVLVTHQLVTGAARCESEDISVGGSDDVSPDVFDCFDYVALGHLHGAQSILRDTVRYCGTPLKYSFSECGHKKSVTVADIGEKGNVKISEIPLAPLRDMREIKGKYADITLRESYENTERGDYMHITLTDEDDVPDAVSKLRVIYPNIMRLDYDNARTRGGGQIPDDIRAEALSPLELFAQFYRYQNNRDMSEEQSEYLTGLIASIWEGEV